MLCLPAVINDVCYDLFIILQDENIARMKAYDPVEVVTAQFPIPIADRKIHNVMVMYATDEDVETITALCQAGQLPKALKYLSRGFRFRPDDHDDEYEILASSDPDANI